MSSVGDFKAWGDTFQLGNNMEHTIDDLDLPPDYDRDRTVLVGYVIYAPLPSPGSTSASYDIDFNDTVIHDEAFVLSGAHPYHVRWKVVAGDKLHIGSNTIQFRVGEVGFPITFSDVVLWYHRIVSTS